MNNVTVTYSRSSGPGGQNVNKLDTKVDLRFHVQTAEWIPESVRGKMLIKVRFLQFACNSWFQEELLPTITSKPNILNVLKSLYLDIFSTKTKSTKMAFLL